MHLEDRLKQVYCLILVFRSFVTYKRATAWLSSSSSSIIKFHVVAGSSSEALCLFVCLLVLEKWHLFFFIGVSNLILCSSRDSLLPLWTIFVVLELSFCSVFFRILVTLPLLQFHCNRGHNTQSKATGDWLGQAWGCWQVFTTGINDAPDILCLFVCSFVCFYKTRKSLLRLPSLLCFSSLFVWRSFLSYVVLF